jgi:hypothetical protein
MPTPNDHESQKPISEAQLWIRLRRLKERKVRIIAKIDAEIAEIKTTLGSVLSEE